MYHIFHEVMIEAREPSKIKTSKPSQSEKHRPSLPMEEREMLGQCKCNVANARREKIHVITRKAVYAAPLTSPSGDTRKKEEKNNY